MQSIEKRLINLGIGLPDAPKPLGNFSPYLIDNGLLYISGQISIDSEGQIIKGKLGEDVDLETGASAARFCGIGILARANAALGDLNTIKKVIKLGAFINSTPSFSSHPKVANGASDLMVDVFGKEIGEHVRFAVGTNSLPSNAAVEVEAVFRISSE